MKTKLKYLVKVSLNRKIKTKWFVLANVLLLILIAGLINADSIIKMFGGDFDEKQEIYVVDNSLKTYDVLKKQNKNYSSVLGDSVFKLKQSNKDYKDIIKKDKNAWVLVFENDNNNVLKAKLVSDGYINTSDYAALSSIINSAKQEIALNESNIDKNELAKISTPIKIERKVLDTSKKSEEEQDQMILGTVFPIFILPFFALTIFLVQMIGAEVNDEKTTRGMEIIISNVSPKVHLLSKIISSNLFVIIQGLLLLLFGAIGLIIRQMLGTGSISKIGDLDIAGTLSHVLSSDVVNQLTYIIPLTLIMILLTFVAYSLLAGVLASMTTNIEDFQQLQTPIMIISLLGYYLGVMAGVFEGSLFIKIFAFVPFVSAILAPCLLVLGQFSIIEFVIAILLVTLTIYLLIKYGFRIYKQGILNYSSKNLWKKMFKALKSK